MGEYAYWVFDLDGTIVDVEPQYAHRVIEQAGRRIGHSFTRRQAEQLWYGLGDRPEGHLRRWGVDPERFWAAFHAVEEPTRRAEHTFLYEDATFIGDLETEVAIVTHCQPYLAEPVLETLDIHDWFDVVLCCNDQVGWKPDPTPIERAVSAFGRSTDEHGAVAGDSPDDVGAAWNAGLDAIHVERHGHERRGSCVRADRRVSHFGELHREPLDQGGKRR